MRTWLDVYPTGRKHCSECKRYRHGIYFNVREWADEPDCTMPLYLQSVCSPCLVQRNRRRNGYNPRPVRPFGPPDSEQYRQRRNERNRTTKKKPKRKRNEAEYKRIWRDAKRAEKRRREELEED